MIQGNDRIIIRDLARKVADIASDPIMSKRRKMWKDHNSLRQTHPMILVFPEGSWSELLPKSTMECEGEKAREIERKLKMKLYQHDHINDDGVIEKTWKVHKKVRGTACEECLVPGDWGVEYKIHESSQSRGAYGFDPIIHDSSDLKKLRIPEMIYDEKSTMREYEEMQDLFGDILDVQLKGLCHVSFHFMQNYIYLRGLEEMMYDLYDNPGIIHEIMNFFVEGSNNMIDQCLDQNLLSLNNDDTYNSSGGNSYTDELPAPGFDPNNIRTCDLWAAAESQEMSEVSPKMHEEFVMQYERQVLSRFGLNGYGCCEDLTNKLDFVFKIPNMRRISVSPWADVEKCAEKMKDNYIFSWKPAPFHLAGEFNPGLIRDYIKHTLEVTKGCVVEMILKDTHTCDNHPERFTEWVRIARELIEEYGGSKNE